MQRSAFHIRACTSRTPRIVTSATRTPTECAFSWNHLPQGLCNAVLAWMACMTPCDSASAAALEALGPTRPLFDGASILSPAKGDALTQRLQEFES